MPLTNSILLFIENNQNLILFFCLIAATFFLLIAYICCLPNYISAFKTAKKEVTEAERLAIEIDAKSCRYTLPKISIVVPTYNAEEQLRKNLPRLLMQQYQGTFEVIVADQNSDDDTSIVVQHLQTQYANLRFTFVPASARNIERRKLAITLGVRAARAEWVIVVNPESYPMSNMWLQNFSAYLSTDTDFVAAYVNYDADNTAATRRATLERLLAQMQCCRFLRQGCVMGCETSNYALRKSWFLQNLGFADSLCLPFGEETILVCKRAEASRSRYLLSESTRLYEEAPSASYLQTLRIYTKETLHHLPHRVRIRAFATRLGIYASHFYFWSIVAFVTAAFLSIPSIADLSNLHIVMASAMLLILLLGLVLSPMLLHRSTKAMGESTFTYTFFTYIMFYPIRNAIVSIMRYVHRGDFVRKFL